MYDETAQGGPDAKEAQMKGSMRMRLALGTTVVLASAAAALIAAAAPAQATNTRPCSPIRMSDRPLCPPAGQAQVQPGSAARAGYCLDGKFFDLLLGQPDLDSRYRGAIPAFYIKDKGLTCDVPAGLRLAALVVADGTGTLWAPGAAPSAIYPYYTS